MEIPQRITSIKEFRLIQNDKLKVSKKFFGRGLNDIILTSMDLIEDDVIIRGDLGKVHMGKNVIIGKSTIIHPCLSAPYPPFEYKNLMIGAFCYIGKNCIISARSIGKYVFIGDNCILSDRVEIGDCVKVLDGTYVPPDIKLLDNSVYGGRPAKYLGEITEGFTKYIEEYCTNYFLSLVVTK